jgi:hypothetical protein
MIGGHARKVAAMRLDFLDQVLVAIVAVGTAAYMQRAEIARQAQLGLVMFTAAARDDAVAGNALLRRRRRREPQVQVAGLGREFAQGPYGHDIAGARCILAAHACCAHCR